LLWWWPGKDISHKKLLKVGKKDTEEYTSSISFLGDWGRSGIEEGLILSYVREKQQKRGEERNIKRKNAATQCRLNCAKPRGILVRNGKNDSMGERGRSEGPSKGSIWLKEKVQYSAINSRFSGAVSEDGS